MFLIDLSDRLLDPIVKLYQPRMLWISRFIDRVITSDPRVVLVVLRIPRSP